MTWFLLWAFISIEKIALFLENGTMIFWWSVVVYVATWILIVMTSNDAETLKVVGDKLRWWRRGAVTIAVVGILMTTTSQLLPTKKELGMIIGGGVTWEVLTSEASKEMGGKVMTILNNELDSVVNSSKAKMIDNRVSLDRATSAASDIGSEVVSQGKVAIGEVTNAATEASKQAIRDTLEGKN